MSSNKEMFEQAIADEPAVANAETVEAVAEQEQDGERNRDERGRFASKAEETQEPNIQAEPETPAAKQQEADQREGYVPSWRLREVNEQREAAERRAAEMNARFQDMERRLAEFQKANEKPKEQADWYADPDAAFRQNMSPIEQRMQDMQRSVTLRASRAEAMVYHGKDAVVEMEQALNEAIAAGHPGLAMLRTEMMASDDPVGIGMRWYQNQKLMKETGGDLSSYRAKLSDELLKDPVFLAKALEAARMPAGNGGGAKTIVQLPPSLSRQSSAGSPRDSEPDTSNRGLYEFATG